MTEGNNDEFREVPHFGGIITVRIRHAADGTSSFSQGYTHKGGDSLPWRLMPLVAYPQGIPVAFVDMQWAPDRSGAAPVTTPYYRVFLGTDREGFLGHQCPACGGYWRGRSDSVSDGITCPYCSVSMSRIDSLTEGQRTYIQACCNAVDAVLAADREGLHEIDLDQLSDRVAKGEASSPFVYFEEAQQEHIVCSRCKSATEILGRFGACHVCGLRANLDTFRLDMEKLRVGLESGGGPSDSVKAAISALEASGRNLIDLLVRHVPLSERRRERAKRIRFHDPKLFGPELREIFDIDAVRWTDPADLAFLALMFSRRHIYEHRGGIADQTYIDAGHDASIRLGQVIRETKGNALRLLAMLERIMTWLQEGFHELISCRVPIEREGMFGIKSIEYRHEGE